MKATSAGGDGPLAARLAHRRLVVFDVDGTLYDQRRLRRAMAVRLLRHLALTGRHSTLRALRAYRRAREATAEAESAEFEAEAIAAAARGGGLATEAARALVADWMQARPLPLLRRCRYGGVAELFAALRRRGTTVGILSDYPAREKMRALGLEADLVAAAGDPGVAVQKPHPAGLLHLMERAGAGPGETILVGDRVDRDGAAGRRAGVAVLIRADRPAGPDAFRDFGLLLPGPDARAA